MISLKGVSVTLDEKKILKQINVDISEKKVVIIGANGSGKSTFLRLLNGLILPTQGKVHIDNLSTHGNDQAIRKKVGFVFQNPDHQIVYPIVSEDLAFGLKNLKLTIKETEQRINAILDQYQLTHLKNNYTHRLSGGEKQMLAICGVLVMQPKYIVFDEPTTLLDLKNRNQIIKMFETMTQNIIVATHDLELATYFDRAICIDQGKVKIDDSPDIAIQKYKALMK